MPDLGWSLNKVAEVVGGTLHGDETVVERIVTDSRQDVVGALYIALKGDKFDGHDFLRDVAQGGAVAVLVDRLASELSIPQIVANDTLKALQALGLARRRELNGPLVAITGSSGKTTTRRLLASISSRRFVTHQPIRNFNNHVGVPLTLLDLETRHQAAVCELGCSDFGEIARLTKISDPDVVLITNVGPAHLERLIDLDGVAKAKGELFLNVRKDSVAVVNLDDPRVAAMPIVSSRRVAFGGRVDAEVSLIEIRQAGVDGQIIVLDIQGEKVECSLSLVGAHNAANATSAAAAAVAIGLNAEEIVAGLKAVSPEPGRLNLHRGPKGALVIDDTYNANPASMRAALAVLSELAVSGRAIAVLADMLELGLKSDEEHLSLGRHVARSGIDMLVTMGKGGALINEGAGEEGMARDRRHTATDQAQAASAVRTWIDDGDVVLVKGSRGMQMEKVVEKLLGEGG